MNATQINGEIKAVLKIEKELNPLVWGLSQKLASAWAKDVRDAKKEAKKEAEKSRVSDVQILSDEEREGYAARILDAALQSGEMSIAELDRFKDELGLTKKGRDIAIHIIDFKDIYPEEADVYAITAEVIKKKVREANEKLRDTDTN